MHGTLTGERAVSGCVLTYMTFDTPTSVLGEPVPVSAAQLESIALALRVAEQTKAPVQQLTTLFPTLTPGDAYVIASVNVAEKLAVGQSIVGRKVGLTSRAMQQQLGVDQPDYGVITTDMIVRAPASVDCAELIAPRVEAEFAFRLGRDLVAGQESAQSLREAIDEIYISMEIIDSRIADWKIGLADTIADNASSARLVVGGGVAATPELFAALPATTLTLSQNGAVIASGEGREVLGDPLLGVEWVVTRLGELGETLRAGEIILAGAVHASVGLQPGTEYTVSAPGFEPVTITTA